MIRTVAQKNAGSGPRLKFIFSVRSEIGPTETAKHFENIVIGFGFVNNFIRRFILQGGAG